MPERIFTKRETIIAVSSGIAAIILDRRYPVVGDKVKEAAEYTETVVKRFDRSTKDIAAGVQRAKNAYDKKE